MGNDKNKKTSAEQWIDIIADNELPAITSTAQMLDKFSSDDVSSLPKLSQAILHDQALSSCVLKVANSVQYIGVKKISTVSRASVVLGIHSVKNICMTAKLIDGLLANKELGDGVYKRLCSLMANSFYAGLLAKMMVSNYSENVQEQVYLAAMLYRIGETSFWSVGTDIAEELIKHEHLPDEEFEAHCEEAMGISFNQLCRGLAKTWNLSDLLVKSLDHPQSRTVEMQLIYLADKLSHFISKPPASKAEFNNVLKEISKVTNMSVPKLTARVNAVREEAINLLNAYEGKQLIEHIKPIPSDSDFGSVTINNGAQRDENSASILSVCKRLTTLTHNSADFNELIKCALISVSQICTFSRTSFFMINDDKSLVKGRFSYNSNGDKETFKANVNIRSKNAFKDSIESKEVMVINDYKSAQWRDRITEEIELLISNGAIIIVPVKIRKRVVGVFVGQVFANKERISEGDSETCSFIVEQLNMCLTSISYH